MSVVLSVSRVDCLAHYICTSLVMVLPRLSSSLLSVCKAYTAYSYFALSLEPYRDTEGLKHLDLDHGRWTRMETIIRDHWERNHARLLFLVRVPGRPRGVVILRNPPRPREAAERFWGWAAGDIVPGRRKALTSPIVFKDIWAFGPLPGANRC
jgi:hypothetical protein